MATSKNICPDNVAANGKKAFVLVARLFFSCHVAKFCQKRNKSLISTEEIVTNTNDEFASSCVF
jgi:hypothetical protein